MIETLADNPGILKPGAIAYICIAGENADDGVRYEAILYEDKVDVLSSEPGSAVLFYPLGDTDKLAAEVMKLRAIVSKDLFTLLDMDVTALMERTGYWEDSTIDGYEYLHERMETYTLAYIQELTKVMWFQRAKLDAAWAEFSCPGDVEDPFASVLMDEGYQYIRRTNAAAVAKLNILRQYKHRPLTWALIKQMLKRLCKKK